MLIPDKLARSLICAFTGSLSSIRLFIFYIDIRAVRRTRIFLVKRLNYTIYMYLYIIVFPRKYTGTLKDRKGEKKKFNRYDEILEVKKN